MNYRHLQIYFFLALLLGAFFLTFFIFRPYIGPLLLAVTFAIIFEPFHRRILSLMPRQESIAALLALAVVLIVVMTPLIILGFQVFQEASQLYGFIASTVGTPQSIGTFLHQRLTSLFPSVFSISPERFSNTVNQYFAQMLTWIVEHLGVIFSNVSKVAFSLVLTLFALYYLFKDGRKLRNVVIALSPLSDHYDKEIFEKLAVVINSVIKGTLAIAVLQGILAGIGFRLFGVPQAALWGSVTAVASLIPILGTALVTLPVVTYLFLIGNIFSALGLLIWVMLLVGTVDNFLRPKLIERGVHIHPFLILLSVLGGASLFGPTGFLLGPLVLSFFFALLDIYRQEFKAYIGEHL